jgi:hypothetical protein
MIETIFIGSMFIVVAAGMYSVGLIVGRHDNQDGLTFAVGQAIREEIDKAIITLQGEFTDLDALSCVHPTCKRRKPQSEASFEHLKAAGLHAVKEELDKEAEKIPDEPPVESLCKKCPIMDGCDYVWTKMMNCEMYNNATAVIEANIEAAESAKNGLPPKFDLSHGSIIGLNPDPSIGEKIGGACKYIGDLKELGFADEEIPYIRYTQTDRGVIGEHPNLAHKPFLITEDVLIQLGVDDLIAIRILDEEQQDA